MDMARIDQTSNSLAVDTDVLFVNVTNNRVGINQSNPNTPLHVVGATTIDGGLTSTLGVIQGYPSSSNPALEDLSDASPTAPA